MKGTGFEAGGSQPFSHAKGIREFPDTDLHPRLCNQVSENGSVHPLQIWD